MAKDDLRSKIARYLLDHYRTAQDGERDAIEEHGDARLSHSLDHADHLDSGAITDGIVALFDGSLLKEFVGPDQIAAIKERVEVDCRSIMHIERSWHADRNPHSDAAKAHRAMYHGPTVWERNRALVEGEK